MTFDESIRALESIAAADAADPAVNPQAVTRVYSHGRRTGGLFFFCTGLRIRPDR